MHHPTLYSACTTSTGIAYTMSDNRLQRESMHVHVVCQFETFQTCSLPQARIVEINYSESMNKKYKKTTLD